MKFIDDLSVAVKIDLKKDIVEDFGRAKPLTYDQRNETKLVEENIMQDIVDHLETFSNEKQMVINSSKSSIMKLCRSKVKAFPVEVKVNGNFLQVKKELKILGVILTPDLKLNDNTNNICKKAYMNMWALRRLKKLGLDSFTLTDYYMKEVRVHLEFAVPVWHSGLSLKLTRDIERVQRIAVNIILGDHSLPYVQSCTKLGHGQDGIKKQT